MIKVSFTITNETYCCSCSLMMHVLADGEQADGEWIFDLLATRFECKDADYITPDTPQDYLGMNVHMDTDYTYLSMTTYITNACKVLNIDDKGRSFKTPISQPIDTESDIFTKILSDKIFEELRDQILFVFVTE